MVMPLSCYHGIKYKSIGLFLVLAQAALLVFYESLAAAVTHASRLFIDQFS
jgi:hypothetical protein